MCRARQGSFGRQLTNQCQPLHPCFAGHVTDLSHLGVNWRMAWHRPFLFGAFKVQRSSNYGAGERRSQDFTSRADLQAAMAA